jgi:hypothetical protein
VRLGCHRCHRRPPWVRLCGEICDYTKPIVRSGRCPLACTPAACGLGASPLLRRGVLPHSVRRCTREGRSIYRCTITEIKRLHVGVACVWRVEGACGQRDHIRTPKSQAGGLTYRRDHPRNSPSKRAARLHREDPPPIHREGNGSTRKRPSE